jgi:purine-binding chemotaxis protein CheW
LVPFATRKVVARDLPLSAPSATLEVLLLAVRDRAYALPVAVVGECMRPLPLAPWTGAPDYVLGIATIRGEPVPVLDPARLAGGASDDPPRRFVTVRAGSRWLALAVADVVGVRQLPASGFAPLPGFLAGVGAGALAGLGTREDGLVGLLDALKLLPAELVMPEVASP